MFLASSEIEKIKENITALNDYNIQGASVDLSLGDRAKIRRRDIEELDLFSINLEKELDIYEEIDLAKGFWLEPQDYLYASSIEKIEIPKNMCGIILPRSTFARIGLILPISSYANPGYKGNLPIIIFNASKAKVRIPPYIRIMQLIFCEIKGEARAYNEQRDSKYHDENLGNPKLNDIELKAILERLQ